MKIMSENAQTIVEGMSPAGPTTRLIVNGAPVEIDLPPRTPLLSALRGPLALKGTRFGCGAGDCGACTVLLDGVPTQSCNLALNGAEGKTIVTVEGLGSKDEPGAIQRIFLDFQAAQCGYCINGIIVSLEGLSMRQPKPPRDQVVAYLDEHHLCRCGSHVRILRIVDALFG
jgi:nicotinate dehydrogenase subunit A